LIYEILPIGEENSISKSELMLLLGLTAEELRSQIERERREGKIICSSRKYGGYYRHSGLSDLKSYVLSEHRSAKSTLYTTKAAYTEYKRLLAEKEQKEKGAIPDQEDTPN